MLIALAIQGQDHRIALGALAGFLVLNWPTARHFLGDAGSFGCGFYLAEAALRCGGLDHPWVPLVLTAPISMDVAMGLYRRHRLGMTFFTPDRLTCPHHVLDRVGGNIRLATPILWLNTSLFAVAAWSPALALAPVLAYAVILIHFNRSFLSMGTE